MFSGISLFYFVCSILGFVFALMGAIFGELAAGGDIDADLGGHDFDFDLDQDIDLSLEGIDVGVGGIGEMPGAAILNTITVSTFVGFFGLSGLLAVWVLKMSPLPSLALSLPTAVLIAAAQFILYLKIFVHAQGSSEATMAETLGCEAEVITPIPADRVGEIAYVIKGSRYTAPAASADKEDIPKRTRVQVVNIRGTTFVVRPL